MKNFPESLTFTFGTLNLKKGSYSTSIDFLKNKVELLVWKDFFKHGTDLEKLMKEITDHHTEHKIEASMDVIEELQEIWIPNEPQFRNLKTFSIDTLAKNSKIQEIFICERKVSISYKLSFNLSYRIELAHDGSYIRSIVDGP